MNIALGSLVRLRRAVLSASGNTLAAIGDTAEVVWFENDQYVVSFTGPKYDFVTEAGHNRVWVPRSQVEETTNDKTKWAAIIAANPVLAEADFASRMAKWNTLKDAADKAGMSDEETMRFIAAGMNNEI
jgi:hypothetical protein